MELDVLRAIAGRQIATVQDVGLALGRMGGHLNRAPDGAPGWLTLMRGMMKLSTLVEGVRLAEKINRSG